MLELTKLFIEENNVLLDTDLNKFIRKGVTLLRDDAREELIEVLRTIKIMDEDLLELLLINKLGFIFPTVEDKTRLTHFVDYQLIINGLDTYFGKNSHELYEFIYNNRDKWRDDMYLDVDRPFGNTIIRTDLR